MKSTKKKPATRKLSSKKTKPKAKPKTKPKTKPKAKPKAKPKSTKSARPIQPKSATYDYNFKEKVVLITGASKG